MYKLQGRRSLLLAGAGVATAAALAVGMAAGLGQAPTPQPSLTVDSPQGIVTLPDSAAADLRVDTLRFASQAEGVNVFTALGKSPGASCLVLADVGPKPDVAVSSCGTPPPGQIHVMTAARPDGSTVGVALMPASATGAVVNGRARPVVGGVSVFTAPKGAGLAVSAVGAPQKTVVGAEALTPDAPADAMPAN